MNQIDLKDRVAIITGGARGIGYAAAERALRSGAQVVLWDIDGARVESAVRDLSTLGTVSADLVELSDAGAVQSATEATLGRHGHIDILVNNAGITGGNGPTWELDPAVWRRVLEVNLTGAFLACRAVVPHMIARGYGRIVNVASIAGKEGNPNAAHYSASKAGLIGLTKSLAKEFAPRGVRVNAVAPGFIRTHMTDALGEDVQAQMKQIIPLGRFGEPVDVANVVMFLVSDTSAYVTGQVINCDGGMITAR